MKKATIGFAVLLMLLITACLPDGAQGESQKNTLIIVSKDGTRHTFDIEVAATPLEQEVGLMFREHMAPDHGMLFEIGQNVTTRFWMKNTLIPLDMLFIADDGTIKTIHEYAEPNSLTPISSEVPVAGVLELNGGRAHALGITPGDKVLHAYFGTHPK